MNAIPIKDRARITAILLRLISELAGGDVDADRAVAAIVVDILDVCYKSRVGEDPCARDEWFEAIEVLEKDWVFTVRKIGDEFCFESKFGYEMKSGTLEKSVGWLSEAGNN
jgi:hypothetical protein